MRRLLPALLLLGSAPLAAQQWQGSIAMTMTSADQRGESIAMVMHRKGSMLANVMTMPASAGPMAGQEMRMIIDESSRTLTMLTPMMPGMMIPPAMTGGKPAKGMKMVSNLGDDLDPNTAAKGSAKPLGTSQTIAGMKCEDYEVTTEGETMQMCLATGIGSFAFANLRGPGSASVPAWARGLQGKFPLQIRDKAGKFAMNVTKITPGAPAASLFEVPEGYADMSAMMGGMGRRPRN
jgi:hypothetical protein